MLPPSHWVCTKVGGVTSKQPLEKKCSLKALVTTLYNFNTLLVFTPPDHDVLVVQLHVRVALGIEQRIRASTGRRSNQLPVPCLSVQQGGLEVYRKLFHVEGSRDKS